MKKIYIVSYLYLPSVIKKNLTTFYCTGETFSRQLYNNAILLMKNVLYNTNCIKSY